jgi:hypothetical protein
VRCRKSNCNSLLPPAKDAQGLSSTAGEDDGKGTTAPPHASIQPPLLKPSYKEVLASESRSAASLAAALGRPATAQDVEMPFPGESSKSTAELEKEKLTAEARRCEQQLAHLHLSPTLFPVLLAETQTRLGVIKEKLAEATAKVPEDPGSVMPLDVLGCTRATLMRSTSL